MEIADIDLECCDFRLNPLLGVANSLQNGYITDGSTCESQGYQVRKRDTSLVWLKMAQDEV